MTSANIQHLIAMIIYMLAVIGIGVFVGTYFNWLVVSSIVIYVVSRATYKKDDVIEKEFEEVVKA